GYMPVVYLDVSLADRLLHLALEDVRSILAVGRIGRCHEASCRRFFYAERLHQTFCSRACASRASVRAYQKRKQQEGGQKSLSKSPSRSTRSEHRKTGEVRHE